MRDLVSEFVGRQVAGWAITGGLLLTVAALGFVALGCLAVALFHYFLPTLGAIGAALATAGLYLAVAAVVGLVAWHRMHGNPRSEARVPGGGAPEQSDTTVLIARLLSEELPKNAVPATLIALVGGIAAGANPDATRSLARDILGALSPREGRPGDDGSRPRAP